MVSPISHRTPQDYRGHHGRGGGLGQVHGQVLESQEVGQDDDHQQEQQQAPQKQAHHRPVQPGGGRQFRQEPGQVGAAQEPASPR